MEQIAKLLFATTLLSIFTYILFFSSMTHSGNGGEYWGFNGVIEPNEAARISFENRDYRFLAVNIDYEQFTRHTMSPEYQLCSNHPFGAANSLHQSSTEPLHNRQSKYLATNFASRYNEIMLDRLAEQMNYYCEN